MMKKHISFGGYDFYVIFGEHDYGHFIAIPNWGVCVEAAEAGDVLYNSENLARCHDATVRMWAAEIAEAINDYCLL